MAAVTSSCGRMAGTGRSAVSVDSSVPEGLSSKVTASGPLRVRCVVGGASHRTSKDCEHAALSISSEEWWRKPAGQGVRDSVEASFFTDFGGECIENWPSVSDRELDTSTWTEHQLETPSTIGVSRGVPVFVMLPLDSINPQTNTVNRKRAMNASLLALKRAGVEGIMMDVWWGIVEKDGPGMYNWSGYRELTEMAKKHGLKVQAVMSFHACGGNVGDSCNIPLPPWVVDKIDSNNDIVYTDKYGNRNYEYLSLGVDELPVLEGRTPVQAYGDYMRSFRDNFSDLLGETIVEIQVGMGPAGELRYPGYPEQHGRWRFPGIGEFQCYDKYMLSNLRARAEAILRPEWGQGGPSDAGNYNSWPENTIFFKRNGGWRTDYGKFFLNWYSEMLLLHGERILAAADGIFRSTGAVLSGKVAGIHWHYNTRSHAAELTAGYYNTRDSDGYLPIARMFGRHGVVLNFTCFEMKDEEQPSQASCSPEGLLRQVAIAARTAGIRLAGENALPRFDQAALEQVRRKSCLRIEAHGEDQSYQEPLSAFTFLRMSENLFHSDNWRLFVPFVRHMQEGGSFENWRHEHQETESTVHAAGPFVYEASQALMYN